MINLNNCDSLANTSLNNSSVKQIKNMLTVPSLFLLGAALVLAVIILLALVSSKCFKFPNTLLYFNIAVADAFMTVAGIIMLSVSIKTAAWSSMALNFDILRYDFPLLSFIKVINQQSVKLCKDNFLFHFHEKYISISFRIHNRKKAFLTLMNRL